LWGLRRWSGGQAAALTGDSLGLRKFGNTHGGENILEDYKILPTQTSVYHFNPTYILLKFALQALLIWEKLQFCCLVNA
jgi:hypothetical protein